MANKYIWVKSGKEDGRVAFWERDDAHPNSEVYVPGDGRAVQVGLTSELQQKLGSGQVVYAEAPKAEVEEEPPRLTAAEARAAKLRERAEA